MLEVVALPKDRTGEVMGALMECGTFELSEDLFALLACREGVALAAEAGPRLKKGLEVEMGFCEELKPFAVGPSTKTWNKFAVWDRPAGATS